MGRYRNDIMTIEERLARLERHVELVERFSSRSFWQALDKAYDSILLRAELKCIICDHRDGRSGYKVLVAECQFGGGRLERYQCPRCDAVFGPMKYLDLAEEIVDLDYQILYSSYQESDSTHNEIRTFRALAPKPGGLFLNWGCGTWCRTIPTLRSEGFDVWGYEPSLPESRDFMVRTRGEISAKFDGIFSNNVIEHFRDPIAQFNEFRGYLKPGGKLAHSSPCYEYCYDFTRFHTLFLLGRSPHILAERTGFEAQQIDKDGEYVNFVYTARR